MSSSDNVMLEKRNPVSSEQLCIIIVDIVERSTALYRNVSRIASKQHGTTMLYYKLPSDAMPNVFLHKACHVGY